MKKIFITALMVSACMFSFAQGKFSATLANTGNLLTFKIRPDATVTTGFSGIEFFLRYPTSSAPFTYGSVVANTTDFPNMAGGVAIPNGGGVPGGGAWEIIHNDPNVSPIAGFDVDHFLYTAPAPATTARSYTGGSVYDVITVELNGTPPAQIDFQFISDESYGIGYLGITDQNGGDLLPAAPSSYFFPITSTTSINGSTVYYMDLTNVPLPVKFLSFSATKNSNTALLNWSVEAEDANTASYEIQRSLSGVDFTTIATVSPLNNGRSSNTYSFTQESLSSIRNKGVIYFRIKQIDRDGKFIYTVIRSVRLDAKGLVFGVFPNPVKTTANVSFDLAESQRVIIKVIDAAGKQVVTSQVQGFKGANITKVEMGKLAAGSYTMSMQAGEEVKTMTLVKANQ